MRSNHERVEDIGRSRLPTIFSSSSMRAILSPYPFPFLVKFSAPISELAKPEDERDDRNGTGSGCRRISAGGENEGQGTHMRGAQTCKPGDPLGWPSIDTPTPSPGASVCRINRACSSKTRLTDLRIASELKDAPQGDFIPPNIRRDQSSSTFQHSRGSSSSGCLDEQRRRAEESSTLQIFVRSLRSKCGMSRVRGKG